MKVPPFAWVSGRAYLVVNFDIEPADKEVAPAALIEHLVRLDTPFLVLRPLSRFERRLLERSSRNAAVEAWAQMIVAPVDRYRNRK